MRDPRNIWEDKFNDASLDDQTWLEPAIDVFDNISSEVYGSKRKRKSFLILFFLIAALIISVSMLLLPVANNISEDTEESDSKVNTSQLSILPDFNSSKSKHKDVEVITKYSRSEEDKIQNITPLLKEENLLVDDPSKNQKESIPSAFQKVKKYTAGNFKNDTKSSLNKSGEFEVLDIVNVSEKRNKEKNNTSAEKNTKENVSSNKSIESQSTKNVDQESPIILTKHIQFLPTIEFNNLNSVSRAKVLDLELQDFITPNKNNPRSYISLGSSFEYWNFGLNNNYTTALNPADFSHSTGKGISFNLNLGTQLYKKLNLVGGISMQKIEFTSGHNSSISYQLNQELDGDASNMFNLTMASPIGFLESDLVVQRNIAASALNTGLVVDLHNEHSIVNLDVNIGLDYKLIESKRLIFIIGFKAGINKFLNINNTLASFDLNNNNFSSGATDIVENQSSVNNLTTYIGSSIKVEYSFCKNLAIGTNIGYSANLAPIYQENDFSTQLGRIQSGVYIKFNF